MEIISDDDEQQQTVEKKRAKSHTMTKIYEEKFTNGHQTYRTLCMLELW